MKFVMVAGHSALAPRKVGFHFWSDYLCARGDEVHFITVGQSRLSMLKGGASPVKPYNQWVNLGKNFFGMTWVPPFHPCLNKPALNNFLLPLFSLYPKFFPESALAQLADADYIVVESGPGLALIPQLAGACKKATIIYEVSDRLVTVGAHPAIIKAEKTALDYFSLIRVPAMIMLKDFPANKPVWYSPQGIHKGDFDRQYPSPYSKPKNVVSVGDMLFDAPAIITMAQAYPDWTFHLFGRNAKLPQSLPNVVEHGEKPIGELTPYIQHADIGLAPYRQAPNCEYLSQSSLKMIQYTYCQLPIVAPEFASAGRPHVMAYESADNPASIRAAFERAINFDRSTINKSRVLSWEEMFEDMLTQSRPGLDSAEILQKRLA
jgi:2-beta-glucuronyltransferase